MYRLSSVTRWNRLDLLFSLVFLVFFFLVAFFRPISSWFLLYVYRTHLTLDKISVYIFTFVFVHKHGSMFHIIIVSEFGCVFREFCHGGRKSIGRLTKWKSKISVISSHSVACWIKNSNATAIAVICSLMGSWFVFGIIFSWCMGGWRCICYCDWQ